MYACFAYCYGLDFVMFAEEKLYESFSEQAQEEWEEIYEGLEAPYSGCCEETCYMGVAVEDWDETIEPPTKPTIETIDEKVKEDVEKMITESKELYPTFWKEFEEKGYVITPYIFFNRSTS
jgi:hypothetical protein